ncbi:MAG: hypothetical protein GQ527_02240, partial [Bacteroidales bacterium]|nr:hypothetical protein [Bacteroidales bacterium]
MIHSSENRKNRCCIFILGMHRSGTSATSGCLSILGYQLGKRIVPAGKPNEKGYFENDSINRFNEDILDLLNAKWHDTMYLPDKWWKDDRLISFKLRLKEIIYEEFSTDDDFVIKDPRISILLPLYSAVFKELKLVTKVIINFRNPLEVASSLKKRDNLSLSKSLLLWMDATLKAEELTREMPRIFVDYNSLLAQPFSSIQQISNQLQLHDDINDHIKTELVSFIETGLNHHHSSSNTNKEEIPSLVFELYELLKTINFQNTAHPDHDLFDKIRNQFYSEFRFFNGIDKSFKIELKTNDDKENEVRYSEGFTENNDYSFILKPSGLISEFWIYPTNQRSSLQLSNLKVMSEEGEPLPAYISETNAEKIIQDGLLFFESETPWIKIQLKTAGILSKINFNLHFFAFSAYTYRSSLKGKKKYETELYKKIDLLQKNLDEVNKDHINSVNNLESILTNLQKETEKLVVHHQHNINSLDAEKKNHEIDLFKKIDLLQKDLDEVNKDHINSVNNLESILANLQKETERLVINHQHDISSLDTEKKNFETELFEKIDLLQKNLDE